jgi:hypothetical protein
MAYVAITKELIELVTFKMVNMRDAELTPLANANTLFDDWIKTPEFETMVEDKLWQPVQHLREQLSSYSTRDTIQVVVTTPENAWALSRHYKMAVPCIYHRDSQYDTAVTTLTIHPDEYLTTAAIAEARHNTQEVVKRWGAVIKQVTDFLQACKSLNEAVKLWPDVVRYIPKQHMDRLQIKTEKAERTSTALEALRKLDLDTIQASTVLARMAATA